MFWFCAALSSRRNARSPTPPASSPWASAWSSLQGAARLPHLRGVRHVRQHARRAARLGGARSAFPGQGPLEARARALLSAPIVPTLARLSAPGVLLVAFQSMVSVGDTYFVGRLGTEPLAGLALVFPLIMLLQMTSAGAMGGGVSSAIARALGAGDARGRAAAGGARAGHRRGDGRGLHPARARASGRSLYRLLGGARRDARARARLLQHRVRRRDRGLAREHALERAARHAATCSRRRSR